VDYEFGDILGRGNFTAVYLATEKPTGRPCAVKIVDRYRCERLKKVEDVYMEKHCLQRLNHPNIVKVYATFQDNAQMFIAMEACSEGELWDLVKTIGTPDTLARHYLAQMFNAFEYMRHAGIVHRDLKCENIMIATPSVVKIIDFGTSKDFENPHIKGSGNRSRAKVFEHYVGTPQFMAPEIIENKSSDFRSDTWAFGCTMFQILTGCPPFHGASEYLCYTRIMDQDLQFPPAINADARDLISKMVVQAADARLGANDVNDIRRHPYFQGVVFEGAHLRPEPVLSLADICLRKIGRQLEEKVDEIEKVLCAWTGKDQLCPEVRGVLDRIRLSKKWQVDATPPEEFS